MVTVYISTPPIQLKEIMPSFSTPRHHSVQVCVVLIMLCMYVT